MAVEDSAALAECLSFTELGVMQIHEALSVFEANRMRRTNAVRQASLDAAMVLHLPDGPEQVARDVALKSKGSGRMTGKNLIGLMDLKTQMWCYGFDAAEDMRKDLERWVAGEREIPR